MRGSRTVAYLVVGLALSMSGCSGDADLLAAFCETHTDPDLEGLDPSKPDEAARLSDAMEAMERNAPEEIKEAVTTTRAGFEAAQTGEVANIDVEKFQAAAQRVEEYAEDECT